MGNNWNARRHISNWVFRKRLKSRQFTIISNNCWGAGAYQEAMIPYKSPFVGLFLLGSDYIELLKDLKYYLQSDLQMIDESKYNFINIERTCGQIPKYPLGLLRNNVEVHFLHYASKDEAREKWERRIGRMNWDPDQLFFKFCDREYDRGLCNDELLMEFDKLNYFHKVCFTSRKYHSIKSNVWISECASQPCVVDGTLLWNMSKKYFDVANWLDNGTGYPSTPYKLINKWF